MALSDVALCSRALIRIGAQPITSFDDGTAESEVAGAMFSPICDALLSSYAWSFASGQIQLNQLVTSPVADYQNAFELPSDFLRAISAGAGGHGRGLNFRIARSELHTDAREVVLSYIFRPEEEVFPAYFDAAVIARLAAEFTIPMTESTTRAEAMFRLAEQEFARARQIDAQQDTPGRIERFTLTDVRG